MSSIYPYAIDGEEQVPSIVDGVTPVNAESVNALRSAIINIENELGVVPSGSYETVRLRLDDLAFQVSQVEACFDIITVEELPASTTKLYPESPGNEVIDRWFINGNWNLDYVYIYAVDGVSTSAAGTYTLVIRKERNGSETDLQVFDLETLSNQTITKIETDDTYSFEEGDFLQIAIISDNLDLTGGTGISVTPKFLRPAADILCGTPGGGGGGSGDGLPDPIEIDGAVIVEDGLGNYEQRRLRQSDIDPDFVISSFSLVGSNLIEVGDTLNNPSFTASYSLTPDSVQIVDNQGNSSQGISSPFTSFTYTNSYTKTSYNATVTFTLTAEEDSVADTETQTKRWVQKVFWGVGVDGGNDETFIENLSNSTLATSRNRAFTLSPGSGEHIYYAYRADFGDATFEVGGFEGGFELVSSTISVTNDFGFTENYRLYKSVNPNLGTTTVTVS